MAFLLLQRSSQSFERQRLICLEELVLVLPKDSFGETQTNPA